MIHPQLYLILYEDNVFITRLRNSNLIIGSNVWVKWSVTLLKVEIVEDVRNSNFLIGSKILINYVFYI